MFEFLFVTMLQTAAGAPLLDAPAPAEVAALEPLPESVLERRNRHQIRCRERMIVGTRIGNRVCMSDADIDKARDDTRNLADSMQRGLLTSNPAVEMCRASFC